MPSLDHKWSGHDIDLLPSFWPKLQVHPQQGQSQNGGYAPKADYAPHETHMPRRFLLNSSVEQTFSSPWALHRAKIAKHTKWYFRGYWSLNSIKSRCTFYFLMLFLPLYLLSTFAENMFLVRPTIHKSAYAWVSPFTSISPEWIDIFWWN